MRKISISARPVALVLLAVFCLASSCQDKRVFPLGEKVVSRLQARPEVSDVIYQYRPTGGEGEDPGLTFTVYLKRGPVSFPDARPIVEDAADEIWRTPANVNQITLVFDSAAQASSAPSNTYGETATGDVVVSMSLSGRSGTVQTASRPGAQEPRSGADNQTFVADLLGSLQAKYGPHPTS